MVAAEIGQTGNRGNHHAGKQLHGGNIAVVEGIGSSGQDLKDAERAPEMPERGGKD